MNTLIFSDTHLTARFEEKKFRYLHSIISSADRVIINGDFWDGFLISFDQFFNSKWQKLFPLLKHKKTVYIFGNHDAKRLNNLEQINYFSDVQTSSHIFVDSGKQFIIEHGQRLFPTEPGCENIGSDFFRKKVLFWSMTEKILSLALGQYYQRLLIKNNRKLKRHVKNSPHKNMYYIFGHTHSPEVDLDNNFINTGIIRHGLAQYMFVRNGKIELVNERY